MARKSPAELKKGLRLLGARLQSVSKPATKTQDSKTFRSELKCLKNSIEATRKQHLWCKRFNLFSVLNRTRNEGFHSDILAWLLNPDESHNFGKKLLDGLFKAISIESTPAYSWISVRREYGIDSKNRFDIIVFTDAWTLVIENKIDAPLGKDQLVRYLKCLKTLGRKPFLIFLTPRQISLAGCHCLSYQQLSSIIAPLLLTTSQPLADSLMDNILFELCQ